MGLADVIHELESKEKEQIAAIFISFIEDHKHSLSTTGGTVTLADLHDTYRTLPKTERKRLPLSGRDLLHTLLRDAKCIVVTTPGEPIKYTEVYGGLFVHYQQAAITVETPAA